jgi:D-beta-D-heptose 7-phosphate kinase / D-beta-D-heptose 1-phosphate adenosyltransferase
VKEALSRLSQVRALVVGDLMVDRYHWGEAERISPEAPVPVVRIVREETRLGGAANVVHNLAALGCRVGVCGVVGEDEPGRRLRADLEALGVAAEGVLVHPGRPTTVKVRVMAHNQQLLRCDWEAMDAIAAALHERVGAWLDGALSDYDGVILSDYGKGLLTPALCQRVIAACRAAGKPVVVDPKGRDYARYHGATCLTPNELEAAAVTGQPLRSEEDALQAAQRLQRELATESLCITRGAKGVLGVTAQGEQRFLPARAREVYDVTGAGDTFIGLLGALLFAKRPFFEAVELANLGAGIVVGKVGTATVSVPELLDFAGGVRKLYGMDEIGALAGRLRAEGKRIAFTNGCFDLLHAGHIQYLQASRAQGDVLIVGLNSDASVRRLKGPARPVIGEEDRAHLLAALACVDYVVIFEDDTPVELIRAVRPHVLTKGADYTVETVVGHDLVREWGGEVALIPLQEGRSTSGLIEKIVAGHRR